MTHQVETWKIKSKISTRSLGELAPNAAQIEGIYGHTKRPGIYHSQMITVDHLLKRVPIKTLTA